MDKNLGKYKANYLVKYNPARSVDGALRSSISGAVQHNTLYTEWLSVESRRQVRETWSYQLFSLGEKYSSLQSIATYEKDILFLRSWMNDIHRELFRKTPHPKYQYDPGFRISHSQKSFSSYLKQLWCMGEIPEPLQCPIDASILGLAGCSATEKRWSYINSIEEHRKKVKVLDRVAASNKLSLPVWELLQFETK